MSTAVSIRFPKPTLQAIFKRRYQRFLADMLLPDGTIFITYQQSIGYTAEEARTEAIWGMRLRIKDNAQGIELL